MAINIISFLRVLVAITLLVVAIAESHSTEANDKSYVNKACSKTLYSAQCFNSLSRYSARINSRPGKLCRYAAKVATYYAEAAKSNAVATAKTKGLTKAESAVAKDCVETTDDAADDLRRCYRALVGAEGSSEKKKKKETKVQLDNARTWASAALTNDVTCTDGMEEMGMGPGKMGKLRESVIKAARSTSVLLAIMKGYCSS